MSRLAFLDRCEVEECGKALTHMETGNFKDLVIRCITTLSFIYVTGVSSTHTGMQYSAVDQIKTNVTIQIVLALNAS